MLCQGICACVAKKKVLMQFFSWVFFLINSQLQYLVCLFEGVKWVCCIVSICCSSLVVLLIYYCGLLYIWSFVPNHFYAIKVAPPFGTNSSQEQCCFHFLFIILKKMDWNMAHPYFICVKWQLGRLNCLWEPCKLKGLFELWTLTGETEGVLYLGLKHCG